MVLLIFPLVFYLTHSSLRYRFPMDPIMLILAAGAVAHLISLARSRNPNVAKNAPRRYRHYPTHLKLLPNAVIVMLYFLE